MVANGALSAGAQHNKYYVNEVKSIMFDGKNVLEASVRRVWSESGKYYTDSITKAMVKGFCFELGTIIRINYMANSNR